MLTQRKNLWLSVFEGEGGDGGTPSPDPKGGTNPPVKTFTQEQVNKLMAENKRTLQTQNQELTTQLEALKTNANLTQAERDELQQRIDTLQNQFLSQEELAKQEREKSEKKWKTDLESAANNSKQWQGRFSQMLTENTISQSAIENKAFSVPQMVEYLGPRSEVVEVIGADKKPTGQYIVVTPMEVEKEGIKSVVKMPVAEAMKKMKEMPERFGNLFKGDGVNGLGGGASNGGGGQPLTFDPNMTDEQYMAWRKKEGLGK